MCRLERPGNSIDVCFADNGAVESVSGFYIWTELVNMFDVKSVACICINCCEV